MNQELANIIHLYWINRSVTVNHGLNVKSLVTYKPVSNKDFFKEFPK